MDFQKINSKYDKKMKKFDNTDDELNADSNAELNAELNFINNNSNSTFADKVKNRVIKTKGRKKSWAEQATIPSPIPDDIEFNDVCFGEDKFNSIAISSNNEYEGLQEVEECNEEDYEVEKYEDNKEVENFNDINEHQDESHQQHIDKINALSNRIEYLEKTIENLVIKNNEQQEMNNSFLSTLDLNYYLKIQIQIHATLNTNNILKILNKKIPLIPNNFPIVTFCDINSNNGNIEFDNTKIITFLKNIEPKNNIKEKHINYWIRKAIEEKYTVRIDVISISIENDNNHIKTKLINIFEGFKKQFEFQKILQKNIEECKTNSKSKEYKPRFYKNSNNTDNNNNVQHNYPKTNSNTRYSYSKNQHNYSF